MPWRRRVYFSDKCREILARRGGEEGYGEGQEEGHVCGLSPQQARNNTAHTSQRPHGRSAHYFVERSWKHGPSRKSADEKPNPGQVTQKLTAESGESGPLSKNGVLTDGSGNAGLPRRPSRSHRASSHPITSASAPLSGIWGCFHFYRDLKWLRDSVLSLFCVQWVMKHF